MDLYRKFAVSMTGLTIHINETAGKTEKGSVPIDARLFNEMVRLASDSRKAMNLNMEYKLSEEIRRLALRYQLEDRAVPPPAKDKPVTKPQPEATP
jgi:hypothetical protein